MEDISFESLLEAGNKAQIEKLEANNHKHGLGNNDIAFLIMKIMEHIFKLRGETCNKVDRYIQINYSLKDKLRYKIIRNIAADIANYAHMLIVYCDNEIKGSYKGD